MSILESLTIQPTVYYTVDEAAHLLQVSPQTALGLLQSRRLNGIRIDDEWRVLGASLLHLTIPEESPEAAQVADWLAASTPALKEVWDNEEDAVYDEL